MRNTTLPIWRDAKCLVQADSPRHGYFTAGFNVFCATGSVYRVDAREQGHLKNGLKRRLAF